MKRRLQSLPAVGFNTLWHMYRYIRFSKILKNTIVIEISRFIPFVRLKRWVYRRCLNMTIGEHTAFAYKALPDLLYPEKITIGKNVIVGYNATILTHEYLTQSFRTGEVVIGDDTMIGANVTILPGVHIGHHVQVGAGCVVSKDIPDYATAYGNPVQIYTKD
ncbi:acyltransferase [Staphylococcus canis]|uniref:Acyltransferase n=1 Tax=Staphylococcus canis TaxID=2724942 RepID=A0ABS0T5P7_9STAP|nr:acyltransferase [Staphylococcus canis]MBI5974071.1 acyltransferase [Staphylococcus canis]